MEFDNIIKDAESRRDVIMGGGYNCIPLPYSRFRQLFPGTEQGKYIIVTANQKIGKTKLTNNLYVYEPIFFMVDNPNIKIKIYYFTLEMAPKIEYYDFLSYLLYRLDGIVINTADLRSTNNEKPVNLDYLELLKTERYQVYIRKFEECVTFISDISNPTGIYKYLRDIGEKRGHYNWQEFSKTDGTKANRHDPLNPYTPDDPEEYVIGIVDNATNLSLESNYKKNDNIEKMSKYLRELRDTFNFTLVLVQHQAQSQEGIENLKMNRLEPTADGLGDCKLTSRDINQMIGLFHPYKFDRDKYEGYDLTKFGNYIRFMTIIEDRDYGAAGNVCPLFFNGASSFFCELPLPEDYQSLSAVYRHIEDLERIKYS